MGNVFSFGWEIDFILWIQTFVNEFTTLLAKFLQICGEEYVLIKVKIARNTVKQAKTGFGLVITTSPEPVFAFAQLLNASKGLIKNVNF